VALFVTLGAVQAKGDTFYNMIDLTDGNWGRGGLNRVRNVLKRRGVKKVKKAPDEKVEPEPESEAEPVRFVSARQKRLYLKGKKGSR
jgi:hypothetical protein